MMNCSRTVIYSFIGIAVFVSVGSFFFIRDNKVPVPAQEAEFQFGRTIAFTVSVKNTSAQRQKNAEILVYAPNRKTAVQLGGSVASNYAHTSQIDSFNNHILHFKFETIPPFGTKVISLNAKVDFMLPPQKSTLQERDFFLSEEHFIEISSAELIQFAKQFESDTPKEAVKKIYDWITSSITQTSYTSKERGALYAFRKRKGDCTEFMHLFTALCRLNNIPARGVSGFLVKQDKLVQANDYHDWVEVYIDGAWRLVDPFNGTFMERQTEYVTMHVHGPAENDLGFHRWKSNNNNLKISMTH